MLATATITYDLSDYGLADFDSRRTKVWATNNVSGPVVDTEGNLIHLGSANGTVNADGTGSITVPTPGTGSNPASWQTTIHVDYPDRNANRGRGRLSLGPFTITVSANLADLVDEQAIPPDYAGELVATVEAGATAAAASATSAAASADAAATIVGLTGEDAAVALLIDTPASDTATALSATIAAVTDGNIIDPDAVGYEVWAILGQSNAQGYATTGLDTTFLDAPDPRVLQFAGSGINVGQVSLATEPLYHRSRKTGANGFGLTFGKLRARQLPENRKVLLVPCAEASTGFGVSGGYTWDKDDATAGVFNLYKYAVGQIRAALATDPNNTLGGVLWLQGENDTGQTQAWYEGKLDALIDGIRTELAAPTMPFIVGQMTPDHIASAGGGYVTINAAHVATPSRKTYTAMAYGTKGLTNPGEDIHYNAAGLREMGRAMFDAIPLAQVNTTGTAPTAPGAPSINRVGTSLYATWDRPVSRVTDYTIQYRLTGAGSWTTFAHTATPDNHATITGVTAGSDYEMRVAAVNATGTSAYSATGTTVGVPVLRDAVGRSMLWALSVRKIHAGYAGACLRVRRSSDSTESDIGFNAAGELDEAALLTFCGAGDGFVVTWYDQSGNGRNFGQATAANQPKIVAAGVVVRSGLRPAMLTDGTDYLTSAFAGLYAAAGSATTTVIEPDFDAAYTTSARFLNEYRAGAGNAFFQWGWGQGTVPAGGVSIGSGNDSGAFPLNTTGGGGNLMVEAHQVLSVTDTGNRVQMLRDSRGLFEPQFYTRAGVTTLTHTALFAQIVNVTVGNWYRGKCSEVVAYGFDLAPWERAIDEANKRAYFATPA